MENTIVTTFMIIVSVVLAVVVFNAVYPAAMSGADAVRGAEERFTSRLKTDVAIIHVCGELDSQGTWQDVNGDGHFNIFLWVKNTGSSRIAAPEMSDLFLGPEGAFGRVVHQSGASGSQPYWTCDVENGDAWDPTTTLKITVHYVSTLESGRYFVKLVLPNGVADDDYFGL